MAFNAFYSSPSEAMRKHPSVSIIILLIAGSFLLTGCVKTKMKGPDLGRIYNRAAAYHRTERNPIIVVPGILGTRLVDDEPGETVWGAFTGEYAKPGTPEGARRLALPMRSGDPLRELTDSVRPDGVLDRVRIRIAGIPIGVRAYFHILAALGVGGYKDQSLGLSGAIDYGDDHFTCFQFGYDWRRDISEAAAELDRFIQEKRAYVLAEKKRRYGIEESELRFDIVAHSMGGLVVRYYLRYGGAPLPETGPVPPPTWAGARNVAKVILVGPPNAGSVEALENLVHGVKLGPMQPRYDAAIIGTMPSVYQLLPRARHHAVIDESVPEKRFLDPYDPKVWEERGWGLASPAIDGTLERLLPEIHDPSERRRVAMNHLRKSLREARRFTEALDQPSSPPPGTSLILVAGDSMPTPAIAAIEPGSQALRIHGTALGDGTVLRSSALMDERIGGEWSPRLITPIDWSQVLFLFHDHLGLTRSQEFTDNVLYLLLEMPPG